MASDPEATDLGPPRAEIELELRPPGIEEQYAERERARRELAWQAFLRVGAAQALARLGIDLAAGQGRQSVSHINHGMPAFSLAVVNSKAEPARARFLA